MRGDSCEKTKNADLKAVDLKPFIHGNYQFTYRDGYIGFCKFSNEQTEYLKFNDFFYRRAFFSSSVTLEFKCEADVCVFSFDYKIADLSSKDTLDVFVGNKCEYSIKVENMPELGTLEFCAHGKGSEVVVYFPIDDDFFIKNFKISAPILKTVRSPKVLWLGDSISQGYGTFVSSGSFVNLIRRKAGFELLNRGIGGYYYDAQCLMPLKEFVPDRIIIAMGTNLHTWADKEKYIADFYKQLNAIYGGIKTLSITPLWRNDPAADREKMDETRKFIEQTCLKFGTECLNGEDLIFHEDKYFFDGLHPNADGAKIYADNVFKYLTQTKFFDI